MVIIKGKDFSSEASNITFGGTTIDNKCLLGFC
jgi:hypothetical protein